MKSARASVVSLHQKEIGGGTVWARQLGGEVKYAYPLTVLLENFYTLMIYSLVFIQEMLI